MASIGNMTLPSTAGYTSLSKPAERPSDSDLEVRETFEKFVGVTFFRQMLKSLRNTQSQAAYFHGGRAEEVFRGQLDEQLADTLAASHGKSIAGPMYESFEMRLRPAGRASTQVSDGAGSLNPTNGGGEADPEVPRIDLLA